MKGIMEFKINALQDSGTYVSIKSYGTSVLVYDIFEKEMSTDSRLDDLAIETVDQFNPDALKTLDSLEKDLENLNTESTSTKKEEEKTQKSSDSDDDKNTTNEVFKQSMKSGMVDEDLFE